MERLPPRQATHGATGRCNICQCDVEGDGGRRNIRLGCRCLIHFDCLSEYVKMELGDSQRVQGGIRCPVHNNSHYLGPEALQALADYYTEAEGLTSGESGPMTRDDAERLRRFMAASDTAEQPAPPDPEPDARSMALIEATSNLCPAGLGFPSHTTRVTVATR